MKSKMIFEPREGFLYLEMSGEYDEQEALGYPARGLKECERLGYKKLLVNSLHMGNANTTAIEKFFIGRKMAEVFGAKLKVAILWNPEDIDKMAEMTANFKGAKVLITGDENEAMEWLLED
jgi:hypothetical protein